jgi:hypothetical protein
MSSHKKTVTPQVGKGESTPLTKRPPTTHTKQGASAPAADNTAKRTDTRSTPRKMTKLKAQIKLGQQHNNDTHPEKPSSSHLTEQQRKYQQTYRGLMAPSGPALHHPAAPLLLELATLGCTSEMGDTWTQELIEAAIKKGAHPSALDPKASRQLRDETLEKVNQGYARLVYWDDIKNNPPPNLKISPIAAIPHKSRKWRMILDLSHGVTLRNVKHPSVNEATNPTVAPKHSMAELGNVLPHII